MEAICAGRAKVKHGLEACGPPQACTSVPFLEVGKKRDLVSEATWKTIGGTKMKIKYRISFRESKSQELLTIIEQYNIKYESLFLPGSTNALISFDVYNDHAAWETISDLVEKYNIPYLHTNVFSKKEIRYAQWCRVRLINHVGYPQPENKWLSTRFTYADYDQENGTFSHQVENFRIKREPQLKNKHFMDLTWPHETFARREVIEKFKAANIKGYLTRDVLIHRTGEPSREILQIVVPKITEADAILRDHPVSTTSNGVVKYMPHTHGILEFTRELLAEREDFVLSKEWFGDRIAFREILVSQRVANLILDNNWKGISLEPVRIEL